MEIIEELEATVLQGLRPDLTILLDVPLAYLRGGGLAAINGIGLNASRTHFLSVYRPPTEKLRSGSRSACRPSLPIARLQKCRMTLLRS